jgi:hypothetical protein
MLLNGVLRVISSLLYVWSLDDIEKPCFLYLKCNVNNFCKLVLKV